MTGFDAELYLRLLGERALVRPEERHAWDSPLLTAAGALLAVGAIARTTADSVLEDYSFAAGLREDDAGGLWGRGTEREVEPVELAPRVIGCDRVISRPAYELQVRYVSLDAGSTTVAVSCRASGLRPQGRRGRGAGMGGPYGGLGTHLHQITLADDRGLKVPAHFSGGGGDGSWRGHLFAQQALAPDTAWLEIDGERVDLVDVEPKGTVAVEALPDEPAAMRHLWTLVAASDQFHGPVELDPAIDALVAAGAVDPEDAALADVLAVAAALGGAPGPGAARGARGLPEPWRSLLSPRSRSGGPTGTAVIGLATPRFDGFVVAALALETDGDAFEVEVEVSPDVVMHDPLDRVGLRPTLTWWARDDRGNPYLGRVDGWGGGEDRGRGGVSFSPALDPRARRFDLMPTALTRRAVISIELPWSMEEAAG